MHSLLLFGGSSEERLVSVASAQNLSRVHDFGSRWFVDDRDAIYEVSREELARHERPFEKPFRPSQPALASKISDVLDQLRGKVVFMGLHGTEGEDGRMQGLFEREGIAYTGSGSSASRDCFDKVHAKERVKGRGITVAAQLVLGEKGRFVDSALLTEFLKTHGRVVIKPIANGSSVGLKFISNENEVAAVMEAVGDSKLGQFMAEAFVTGRELTVGVVDDEKGLRAIPPSEVVLAEGRSFDYEGKYLGKGTTEITPADLSTGEWQAAQKLALDAHVTLGCYGYTRTDMILSKGELFYLETNTLPGLSKASFVPQQLQADGTSLESFVANQLAKATLR